jgi:putative transposase
MSRYRRAPSGTTFFFTVVAYRRRPILCKEPVISALRDAISRVRAQRPFFLDAFVLLPDHLHCIWTMPAEDSNFSVRWSLIKHHVSFACRHLSVDESTTQSRRKHRDAGIWQRRFWEHRIRDDADLQRHVDYVHINPVKHGLAQSACQWPYSTFHRYLKVGMYPVDWAGAPRQDALDFE